MRERALKVVPRTAVLVLGLVLGAQLLWHHHLPSPIPRAQALPSPPPRAWLELMSLGDPVVMSKLVTLWLQAFDNQPGISIPFAALNYRRVEAWLDRALDLDPRSRYPLLAASRLYAMVPDSAKQRQMLDFVHRRFLEQPNQRWPWLAHATLLAKHRLHDLPLALRYARDLTAYATGPEVPFWARDLSLILLQDMGEREAARGMIAALLASGEITDPHEVAFLERRLAELETGLPAGRGGPQDVEKSTPR